VWKLHPGYSEYKKESSETHNNYSLQDLAQSALTYGSEACTACERDENTSNSRNKIYKSSRLTRLDYKMNLNIAKELNTQLIMEFI
jgi:hypothetical protein